MDTWLVLMLVLLCNHGPQASQSSKRLLQVFSPFVFCMSQLRAHVFPWLIVSAVHACEPRSFASSQRVPLASAVDGAVFKARLAAQRRRRAGILSIENRSCFIIFEMVIFICCVQTEVCLDAGDCWCEELSFLVMCSVKSPGAVLHI